MNKEEVLNRSRKGNQGGNEREKQITSKVNEIGFITISGITALRAIDVLFSYDTLINISLYLLITITSSVFLYAINYYYKREIKYLIMTFLFAVIAIALLLNIKEITFY